MKAENAETRQPLPGYSPQMKQLREAHKRRINKAILLLQDEDWQKDTRMGSVIILTGDPDGRDIAHVAEVSFNLGRDQSHPDSPLTMQIRVHGSLSVGAEKKGLPILWEFWGDVDIDGFVQSRYMSRDEYQANAGDDNLNPMSYVSRGLAEARIDLFSLLRAPKLETFEVDEP